jgi:hypothetical protein
MKNSTRFERGDFVQTSNGTAIVLEATTTKTPEKRGLPGGNNRVEYTVRHLGRGGKSIAFLDSETGVYPSTKLMGCTPDAAFQFLGYAETEEDEEEEFVESRPLPRMDERDHSKTINKPSNRFATSKDSIEIPPVLHDALTTITNPTDRAEIIYFLRTAKAPKEMTKDMVGEDTVFADWIPRNEVGRNYVRLQLMPEYQERSLWIYEIDKGNPNGGEGEIHIKPEHLPEIIQKLIQAHGQFLHGTIPGSTREDREASVRNGEHVKADPILTQEELEKLSIVELAADDVMPESFAEKLAEVGPEPEEEPRLLSSEQRAEEMRKSNRAETLGKLEEDATALAERTAQVEEPAQVEKPKRKFRKKRRTTVDEEEKPRSFATFGGTPLPPAKRTYRTDPPEGQ